MTTTERKDRVALLTTGRAAERLGVSRRTLSRYVERGDARPTQTLPSGRYLWSENDIDCLIGAGAR